MTRSMTHSLWVRQTAYTVLVVAVVAFVITGIEILSSYHDERGRVVDLGNNLIDSFYDASARAAFHVDRLQAESVIEGLMKFEELRSASITTDLNSVLARRTRRITEEKASRLAVWLFDDISSFRRDLIVDRTAFVTGQQRIAGSGMVSVGEIEIRADPAVVGRIFVEAIRARLIDLAVEFLVLASALAYLFYATMTRPLSNIAEQLAAIDPHGADLDPLTHVKSHEDDELGLVVDRINNLLKKIDEQQLDLVHREKVAALGSMIAEVAHELNNPLAVVTAQAELLAETATDQKTRDRAQKILRPAKRCASIVRKFLSLARQRKIEKVVLGVSDMINESVEMLDYQLSKRNISVDVDIDSDVANIRADGSQLGQVMINILMNAQQALGSVERDRRILIRAYNADDDGCIEISIKDNGPGIPDEIRPRVFDHFFTTKPEGRGTGLGLSFCKSVVEAHGGSISVHDVAPQGTEVLIHLPGTTEAELSSSVPADSGKKNESLTVLVVDDEETLAKSIAEVLTRYGHSPTAVFSADEAMECLNSSDFDVILADVHMPGVDGMEFYWRVRAMNAALAERFVFVTGDSLDPQLADFFDKEHKPHINKPFEIRELIAIVQKQFKEGAAHA